jgi:hypothetical protein
MLASMYNLLAVLRRNRATNMLWMLYSATLWTYGWDATLAQAPPAVTALHTRSFQLTTPPLAYRKELVEQGILIKAPASVDGGALTAAAVIVTQMLGNVRSDIRARLMASKAAIAITPKDRYVTALPEFARQSGRKDGTGREYDSFNIRGLGAVVGQSVTATAEENLLHLSGDTMKGMSVTHHEFAHAVMNLGFNRADRKAWTKIYRNGEANILFKDCGTEGDFAMHNPDEYWAVLSTAYFSRNWPVLNTPAIILSHDSAAYEFLRKIYGPPPSQR